MQLVTVAASTDKKRTKLQKKICFFMCVNFNYYIVTEFDCKWLWMMISEKQHFSTSLLSVFCNMSKNHFEEQWVSISSETKKIDHSLSLISQSIKLVL
jgi:hypothetical protein